MLCAKQVCLSLLGAVRGQQGCAEVRFHALAQRVFGIHLEVDETSHISQLVHSLGSTTQLLVDMKKTNSLESAKLTKLQLLHFRWAFAGRGIRAQFVPNLIE